MTKAPKQTDVSGTRPEDHAPHGANGTHDASGKKPVWFRQMNRVHSSIWKNDQNGEVRYTIAVFRSYLDRRNNETKRVFYFDQQDLKDVRAVCAEAEAQILSLKGMTTEAGED